MNIQYNGPVYPGYLPIMYYGNEVPPPPIMQKKVSLPIIGTMPLTYGTATKGVIGIVVAYFIYKQIKKHMTTEWKDEDTHLDITDFRWPIIYLVAIFSGLIVGEVIIRKIQNK